MSNHFIPIFKCLFVGIAVLFITNKIQAQEQISVSIDSFYLVNERTLLGKFDEDLVLEASQRKKMKLERMLMLKKRMLILDTLNLSDKQKRKLLKEISHGAYSSKWKELLAELYYEEE